MGFRSHVLEPHRPFRLFPFFLLVVFLIDSYPLSGLAALSGDASYLNDLIDRAAVAHLSEKREWHVLLHYRSTLTGGVSSMQDDPGFFLALEGKTDPHAELAATLTGFFSEELIGRSKQPAQCAFVARYHWLNEIGRAHV